MADTVPDITDDALRSAVESAVDTATSEYVLSQGLAPAPAPHRTTATALLCAPPTSPRSATTKDIRAEVAIALGCSMDAIRAYKHQIRDMIVEAFAAKQAKPASKAPAASAKKPATSTSSGPARSRSAHALVQYVRAAAIGPGIYAGLADLPEKEYVQQLSQRLKEQGAMFDGLVPTRKDIAAAATATELRRATDGIDTGNIVTGKRRRGAAAAQPKARAEPSTTSSSSASDAGEDSDDSLFE